MSESQLVIATGLLAFVLVFPPLIAVGMTRGFRFLFGNRREATELPEWANRAVRAQRNMIDTLVPFGVILIGVQMAGVSNDDTHLGAALFFWGRVAHAGVYIAGIPYLRTIAFLVSLNGMFRIARTVVTVPALSSLF